MHRRHPEFDLNRKREHDVDLEKENQQLKTNLQSKETELQSIKMQKVERNQFSCDKKKYLRIVKAVDDERIRNYEENIRQLRVSNKNAFETKFYLNLCAG